MINFLKQVRIIDITAIVMGPYATQMLGDMGASVIKVEPLEGELFRHIGPMRSKGMGANSLNCNRNKRSIAVDLKTEAGMGILRDLVRTADVVVHNMRAKAAAKLGITYEMVCSVSPNAIFCEAWGYGQEGPYRDEPAFDDIIQSYSGLASINADEADHPRFIPTILCDKVTALYVTQAVLGALYHRASTGRGVYLEVPMFETNVAFFMMEHLSGRTFDPPEGEFGYRRVIERKPMPTKDGHIASGVYTFAHWQRFFKAIGREDLLSHDWLKDQTAISSNIGNLYSLMAKEIMPQRTSDAWLAILRDLDIPCAPILRLGELTSDEHLRAVSLFQEIEHPSEGRLTNIRVPYRVKGVEGRPDIHAPLTGEHTVRILKEMGYAEERIAELHESNVIDAAELTC